MEPAHKKAKIADFLADVKDNEKALRHKWAQSLPVEDRDRVMQEYDKIKQVIVDRTPSIPMILSLDTSDSEKASMIEEYNVLRNMDRGQMEYIHAKRQLYDRIKSNTLMTQGDSNTINEIIGPSDVPLIKRIIASDHNDEYKRTMITLSNRLDQISPSSEEYHKLYDRITTILNLPASMKGIARDRDNADILMQLKENMDDKLYGQNDTKMRILEVVGSILINPDVTNKCIAFVGSAGVGKTTLGRALADALSLPMYQISLGGMKEESAIKGHGSTYIGSRPGAIVDALTSMKCLDGILFLDEFDKVAEDGTAKDALLHIMDGSQDTDFRDNFIPEVAIDLSRLIKIVSINDINDVGGVLRTRLPMVGFNDYTVSDKIKIARNHFIPSLMNELNINITIKKSVVEYIINKSKRRYEPGARQLQHNLRTIFNRLNIISMLTKERAREMGIKYYINMSDEFILTQDHVDKLFYEYAPKKLHS